jgi:excisionase family DNA binding protein
MTIEEAAKYLNRSVRTLKRYIKQRRLTYIQYGPRSPIEFREVDLVEFQRKNTIKAV